MSYLRPKVLHITTVSPLLPPLFSAFLSLSFLSLFFLPFFLLKSSHIFLIYPRTMHFLLIHYEQCNRIC